MSLQDDRALVARHLIGALSPEEIRTLMQRALADQDLFDELLAIEDVRNAFQDPSFRAVVAADLRERVPQKRTLMQWLWRVRVRTIWLPVAAAAVATILIVTLRSPNESTPGLRIELGGVQATERQVELSRALPKEPPKLEIPPSAEAIAPNKGSLAFDRPGVIPDYRSGDTMRIGFQLEQAASVIVVEELPDGSTLRLFPNRYQGSAKVPANTLVLIPPAGQGPLRVEGLPGTRKVWALIFAAGIDPLDFSRPWEETRRLARTLKRQYRVVP